MGQNRREEINFQPAASTGRENYGWCLMEGILCYNPSSGCNPDGLVLLVVEYDHSVDCSVTGGYVYRGSLYPSLGGHYLYGDFCTGAFFRLESSPSSGWTVMPLGDTPYSISTFGEDKDCELYPANYGTGSIYQIGYDGPTTTFTDVPLSHNLHPYIEALYSAGITAGCSVFPPIYCPDSPVTRGQMAVFIECAVGNLTPTPSPSGMFTDLVPADPFTPFIEQLYNDGITSGCSVNPLKYCPNDFVTRGQTAVFIVRAFGLPLP